MLIEGGCIITDGRCPQTAHQGLHPFYQTRSRKAKKQINGRITPGRIQALSQKNKWFLDKTRHFEGQPRDRDYKCHTLQAHSAERYMHTRDTKDIYVCMVGFFPLSIQQLIDAERSTFFSVCVSPDTLVTTKDLSHYEEFTSARGHASQATHLPRAYSTH